MEKREPSYTLGGNVVSVATIQNSIVVLKKKKFELPYAPTIPLLGTYLDKTASKRYMHPYVRISTTHNSQDMEVT